MDQHRAMKTILRFLMAVTLIGAFPTRAAIYTVTSTFDAATANTNLLAGTLRKAIMDANAHPGPDEIRFNLPGYNPVIVLASALPPITQTVSIDAETPDPNGRITINGDWFYPVAAAFDLQSGNSNVIRGFNLMSTLVGIQIEANCNFNVIENNYIGTEYTGMQPPGNHRGEIGIALSNSSSNLLRGNVIALQNQDGIQILGGSGNQIMGNNIGTDRNGTAGFLSMANGRHGIAIDSSQRNSIGSIDEPNIISGNDGIGIAIGVLNPGFSASSNIIAYNYIGVDSYQRPLGNGSYGIEINQKRGNQILNNWIGGNYAHGIYILGSSAVSNSIAGNVLGQARPGGGWPPVSPPDSPAAGRMFQGNWGDGINIALGQYNQVADNTIYGNGGNGVQLDKASFNRVELNFIEWNRLAGVFIQTFTSSFANANRVGGNYITGHTYPGIVVTATGVNATATGNDLSHNNICGNRDRSATTQPIGIDLGGTNEPVVYSAGWAPTLTNITSRGDGITPNDLNDSDGGPNRLQNYPDLTSAVLSNNFVYVAGKLIGLTGRVYELSFYSDRQFPEACSGTKPTEGSYFISSRLITNSPSGDFAVSFFTLAAELGNGVSLSAIARDLVNGDSSEYSPCVELVPSPNHRPVANNDAATVDEDQGTDIAVLPNDGDPDGDPIHLSLLGQPAHGIAFELPNGKIRYLPNPDFHGNDSFYYFIADPSDARDFAIVQIQVGSINDGPVALNDVANTLTNTPVNIAVLANDSDGDGDVLSVTAAFGAVSGTTVVNLNGTITYTPVGNFSGLDVFTYQINDGNGGVDIAAVAVAVTGSTPGPDLAVAQTASASRVPVGSNVVFSIIVTNQGPGSAGGVMLFDQLPRNCQFQSATSSQGSYTNTGAAVTFNLGTVPPNGAVMAQVIVQATASGELLNRATASASLLDANPYNNTAETVSYAQSGLAPAPSIARTNGSVVIAWPVVPSGYRLLQRASLSGAPWLPVPVAPQVSGSQMRATIPAHSDKKFFRLSP